MKLGIICPVAHLQDFAIQSDFHLILPHLYNQYPEYKEFYRERIKQGDFVTQDSSVFELGESLDYHYLLEQAEELQVSEVVAPDVLRNSEESRKLLLEFLDYRSTSNSKISVFAALQGRTLQGMVDYFFELNSISEVSTIGIPFDIDHQTSYSLGVRSLTLRRVLNRWGVVQEIEKTCILAETRIVKQIHLLGLSDGVELQRQSLCPWIRSCDSSSAYVHGSAGIMYVDRGLPIEKIQTKLDFGSKLTHELQYVAVNWNIKKLKQFTQCYDPSFISASTELHEMQTVRNS